MDGEENEVVQGVLPLDSGLRDYFVDHIGIRPSSHKPSKFPTMLSGL